MTLESLPIDQRQSVERMLASVRDQDHAERLYASASKRVYRDQFGADWHTLYVSRPQFCAYLFALNQLRLSHP
jgi:hypothetical protein